MQVILRIGPFRQLRKGPIDSQSLRSASARTQWLLGMIGSEVGTHYSPLRAT